MRGSNFDLVRVVTVTVAAARLRKWSRLERLITRKQWAIFRLQPLGIPSDLLGFIIVYHRPVYYYVRSQTAPISQSQPKFHGAG